MKPHRDTPVPDEKKPNSAEASTEESDSSRGTPPPAATQQLQGFPTRLPLPSPAIVRAIPIHAPEPYTRRLDSEDARLRWLAQMLLAFGDANISFAINSSLSNPSIADVVACARTARTEAQANIARDMLEASIEDLLGRNANSWAAFVFDLLLAGTYDQRTDTNKNGIGQIEQTILATIDDDDQGGMHLKRLAPRGPLLDILAYLLLSSSLMRYNQCTDYDRNEEDIDVDRVLKQFIDQQLAFPSGLEQTQTDPLLEIDCLPSCLKWCISVLESNLVIPLDVRGIVGNQVTAVYTVLCTLWDVWLRFCLPSSNAVTRNTNTVPSPKWADDVAVKSELGISATELLTTVVCMIMAEVSQQNAEASQQNADISDTILKRALAGARALALKCLSSQDLIHRFLKQVRITNSPRMAGPGEEHVSLYGFVHTPADAAAMVRPFREFVAKSLQISDLPVLEPGAVISPLALAEPDPLLYDNQHLAHLHAQVSLVGREGE